MIKELLVEAKDKLSEWCWNFEGNGDPDSTQFSYCRECGVVEYKSHKPTCAHIERIKRMEKVIDDL